MEKSVYTDEYQVVIDLLRELRTESGMTQVQLAEALDQSQSFVSKYERGDRRLDVIQLKTVCEDKFRTYSKTQNEKSKFKNEDPTRLCIIPTPLHLPTE